MRPSIAPPAHRYNDPLCLPSPAGNFKPVDPASPWGKNILENIPEARYINIERHPATPPRCDNRDCYTIRLRRRQWKWMLITILDRHKQLLFQFCSNACLHAACPGIQKNSPA